MRLDIEFVVQIPGSIIGLTAGGFLGLTAPAAPRVVVAPNGAKFKERGRGFAAGWGLLAQAGCVEGL